MFVHLIESDLFFLYMPVLFSVMYYMFPDINTKLKAKKNLIDLLERGRGGKR